VTKVNISDDLKIAKIYLSFFKNKKSESEIIKEIISKTNIIRYQIGLRIKLKYIPKLRFYYDDSILQSEKINQLFKNINTND